MVPEPAPSPLKTATEGPRPPEAQGPHGWSLLLPLRLTVVSTDVQWEVIGQQALLGKCQTDSASNSLEFIESTLLYLLTNFSEWDVGEVSIQGSAVEGWAGPS